MLTDLERAYLLVPKALPTSTHYLNLRLALPRGLWAKLRAQVLKRAHHQCELCASKRAPLHAHEVWMFDFARQSQTLTNIVMLCLHCHRLQHMNLFALQLSQGKAVPYATLKHYNALTHSQLSLDQLLSLANTNAARYEAVAWEVIISEAMLSDLLKRLFVEYH